MSTKIFFSWQADTPRKNGRDLIEGALQQAIDQLGQDATIEPAVREDLSLDKDTKGIPGSPAIVDTIFRKIDGAAVFVADVTFTGSRIDGRPTPNPNVLIEYGWALKSLTSSRILRVMNTSYGEPTAETMPFDMRHLRWPLQYECAEDADKTKRDHVRNSLAGYFNTGIRLVLESDATVMDPASGTRTRLEVLITDSDTYFQRDDGYGFQSWDFHIRNRGSVVADNVVVRLVDITPRPRSNLWGRMRLPFTVVHRGGAVEMGGTRINPGDHVIYQAIRGQQDGVKFVVHGLGYPSSGQDQQFDMERDEAWSFRYRITSANANDVEFGLQLSIVDDRLVVRRADELPVK